MSNEFCKGAVSRILVIGAGVVGLTTALCLREAGHDVVVAADRFAPEITSVVAGALWEWPPAVCGRHRDEVSLARSKAWCMTSYRKFLRLAADPHTGVFVRPATFYFRQPIAEIPIEHTKLRELRQHVAGVRRDPALAIENGISAHAGILDAYSYPAPMIDTDRYLGWLMTQVRLRGCQVTRAHFENLAASERDVLREFDVDLIVNCAGLGAIHLTGEDMYPLRGALIYAHNDGTTMPKVGAAHCVAFDESVGGQNMVFIVPRGDNLFVLGGLVEADEWDTDLTFTTYQPIRDMLTRCQEFLPALRQARLVANPSPGPITSPAIEVEPMIRVGLRPTRVGGVRLDREAGTRIVHNVGHGGSGVTLSWGCAQEVVRITHQYSTGRVPS